MQLSDRQKLYEGIESGRILVPNLPVMVRLDGRSFHTWCKGMERPYDWRIQELFDSVAASLVEQTNAVVSYTQSDEISLILWNYGKPESEIFFNGRIQKLTSVLASLCTAKFNQLAPNYFPNKPLAIFDCRVWNVPTPEEAVNCLIFRELDATRNSISMAAQSVFSHKQLHKKSSSEMQDMLWKSGINWNDYTSRFKRGAYFKRRIVNHCLTSEELEKLPERHQARNNPEFSFIRHEIQEMQLPPLLKIKNRVGVIFNDDPIELSAAL